MNLTTTHHQASMCSPEVIINVVLQGDKQLPLACLLEISAARSVGKADKQTTLAVTRIKYHALGRYVVILCYGILCYVR